MTLGAIFHDSIDDILHFLSTMGVTAILVIGAVFGAIIGIKFYERRRFYKALRMARITVQELKTLIDDGQEPLIVDARSHIDRRARCVERVASSAAQRQSAAAAGRRLRPTVG
jgi:hypothetical protein